MKTYCPICYEFKQMYKRGLAYRGYVGYYGGMANTAQFFRVMHHKNHKNKVTGFRRVGVK